MTKGRIRLEWDGRVLEEQEDGSITISLNREDLLECTVQIYGEYLLKGGKKSGFGKYIDEELRKVREERIKREYGKQES